MNRLERLQHILETDIPISKSIGIRVVSYTSGCMVLAAPLAANINHKETAFAGSINAVATLAGWSLLWYILDETALPGKIVIQDSAIQYLHPVTTDFSAKCCIREAAELARFLAILRRKQRARIELHGEIWEADRLAVAFSGRYVVQSSKPPPQALR